MIRSFIFCLFLINCQSLKEDNQEDPMQKMMEKHFALFHQRLDQVELQIKTQQAKMVLLEEGLKLGFTPKNTQSKEPQELPTTKPKMLPKQTQSQKQTQDLAQKIAEGEELFQKGRYAEAYFLFSEIEKQYSPAEHHEKTAYWIGRCWYQLGQWQGAKDVFYRASQLSQDPETKSSARLYLAKTDLKLGLKTQAAKSLQMILRQEPKSSSTAQAAKEMLHKMGEHL